MDGISERGTCCARPLPSTADGTRRQSLASPGPALGLSTAKLSGGHRRYPLIDPLG